MKYNYFLAIIFLTVVAVGCQTQPVTTTDSSITVQSWTSQDGNQVILRIPSEQRTDYFDNDKSRMCFRFSIRGMWNPTNERGLLVSPNGQELVGVLLLSRRDLDNYEGNNLIAKAISLHVAETDRRLNSSPIASHTDEIHTDSGNVVRWTGDWKVSQQGQDLIARIVRWLIVVNQNWVAVVTASHGSGGGDMAMKIIRSLEYSDSPDCYWPKIRPILSAPCHQCGT